ncbi:hypothetical protein E1193_02320 [Micromonospora sp. KC606]|nr:hypothetical protein E1193_02320 [Micromonospora sp. KC606]
MPAVLGESLRQLGQRHTDEREGMLGRTCPVERQVQGTAAAGEPSGSSWRSDWAVRPHSPAALAGGRRQETRVPDGD